MDSGGPPFIHIIRPLPLYKGIPDRAYLSHYPDDRGVWDVEPSLTSPFQDSGVSKLFINCSWVSYGL